jgi:hypothetical protein
LPGGCEENHEISLLYTSVITVLNAIFLFLNLSCVYSLIVNSLFSFFFLGGVRLSPLGTSATVGLLYQPRTIDDDYGAVGGIRIGRGNRYATAVCISLISNLLVTMST